eukprot:UN05048
MKESYLLGKYSSSIEDLDENSPDAQRILRNTEVLLERKNVTKMELLQALLHIEEMDNRKGIIRRVTGLFNCINLLWLISIIGIVVVFGPTVHYLIGPYLGTLFREP